MQQKFFVLVLMAGLLGGCASVPSMFTEPMPGAPDLSQVNTDIDQHKGERVRWGGVIAAVKNKEQETWVEVVEYRLDRRGRPVDGNSQGRFFLKFGGFLEPRDYEEGREITAVGEVSASVTQKIGKYNYVYPVVAVTDSDFIVWNQTADYGPSNAYPYRYYERDPFYSPFYSPFYDPFYAPFYRSYFYSGYPYYWPYRYNGGRYMRHPRSIY